MVCIGAVVVVIIQDAIRRGIVNPQATAQRPCLLQHIHCKGKLTEVCLRPTDNRRGYQTLSLVCYT